MAECFGMAVRDLYFRTPHREMCQVRGILSNIRTCPAFSIFSSLRVPIERVEKVNFEKFQVFGWLHLTTIFTRFISCTLDTQIGCDSAAMVDSSPVGCM